MIATILLALWFFLPAAVANAAPIFVSNISTLQGLKRPMDFGKTFRGKRIFGANKTFLGLISGIIAATIVVFFQKIIVDGNSYLQEITVNVNYPEMSILLFGILFGVGALGGDAVESFFKRQIGIKPGERWVPFDQIDYILGTIVITYPFVQLSVLNYLLMLFFWTIIHLVSSYIGYLLKLKKHPI